MLKRYGLIKVALQQSAAGKATGGGRRVNILHKYPKL